MPELPEVEVVRRTLGPRVVGRRVIRVVRGRHPVVRPVEQAASGGLLQGQRIGELRRHGKQLALVGDSGGPGGVVVVHLGMTGTLRYGARSEPDSVNPGPGSQSPARWDEVPRQLAGGLPGAHVHVVWHLDDGGQIVFRDPRRFGGLWVLPDVAELEARWQALGPDGLTVTGEALRAATRRTRRAIKAVLLDQSAVAGVGNIYADEALHRARIHPGRDARTLRRPSLERLAGSSVAVLSRAVQAGGSTLRDYVDATGDAGGFQHEHRVYGRSGLPCLTCGARLRMGRLAGRATVWCPACQRMDRSRMRWIPEKE
jgi:formamidopyrimidine-DNA glycosylase